MEKKRFPVYDIEKLAGLNVDVRYPKSWYENTYRGSAKFSNKKKIQGKLLDNNDEYNEELLSLTLGKKQIFGTTKLANLFLESPNRFFWGNPKAEMRALLRKVLVSKPGTRITLYQWFYKKRKYQRVGYDLGKIGKRTGWWNRVVG